MTVFDFVVFAVIILFVLLGMLRGFLGELFSLIVWILSASFTAMLQSPVNNLTSKSISNPIISNSISAFIIFTIVVIGLSMVSKKLEAKIKTQIPRSINVNLGMSFGFIKAFLINSLVFLTIISVTGNTEDLGTKSGPKWLKDSITYRPLSFGGYILLPLYNSMSGDLNKQFEQEKIVGEMVEKIEDKKEDNEKEVGYKDRQRDELNHLIEVVE
ncbi:MAG: CvpA family protein [Rickettsiales bacterium]|jgi:membrane protein required for colicin V production|nr:CvpA family protein [Rickettsiales bacterium]